MSIASFLGELWLLSLEKQTGVDVWGREAGPAAAGSWEQFSGRREMGLRQCPDWKNARGPWLLRPFAHRTASRR